MDDSAHVERFVEKPKVSSLCMSIRYATVCQPHILLIEVSNSGFMQQLLHGPSLSSSPESGSEADHMFLRALSASFSLVPVGRGLVMSG